MLELSALFPTVGLSFSGSINKDMWGEQSFPCIYKKAAPRFKLIKLSISVTHRTNTQSEQQKIDPEVSRMLLHRRTFQRQTPVFPEYKKKTTTILKCFSNDSYLYSSFPSYTLCIHCLHHTMRTFCNYLYCTTQQHTVSFTNCFECVPCQL